MLRMAQALAFFKPAIAAKSQSKLHVLSIPKRSPDVNVLDYLIWSEIEKRLRRQERNMPANKKETREQFVKRLDRTAANLPASVINKAIGNMQTRVQRLLKAKGGLFEEGGRSKRSL